MADLIIDLPNGNTLVTVDLSGFPIPSDHPPETSGLPSIISSSNAADKGTHLATV